MLKKISILAIGLILTASIIIGLAWAYNRATKKRIGSLFTTLKQATEYAAEQPEFPPADHESGKDVNWLNPTYKAYHYPQVPNLIKRVVSLFSTTTQQQFNEEQFKNKMENITYQREGENIIGKFITQLFIKPASKVYLIGRLEGSLHSLLRMLSWMKEEGIIDNELKIRNDSDYLIFSSDSIGGGPYNLETLWTILLLIEKNPQNVHMIQGTMEYESSWKNFALKEELQVRLATQREQKIPLDDTLVSFFNTFPMGIYISLPDQPSQAIFISDFSQNDLPISQKSIGKTKNNETQTTAYHKLIDKKNRDRANIGLSAIITTEPLRSTNHAPEGLAILDQIQGTTRWIHISSPTQAHQALYQFSNDAFVMLTINDPLNLSTLTLYNRSIQGNEPFKRQGTFNILSGAAAQENQKRVEEVVIGSTLSLERGIPFIGRAVQRGALARISQTNLSGGIHGKTIRITMLNDDYQADLTRKNLKEFINQNIDIILLLIGSSNLKGSLDLVTENKINVFFPVTGAPDFRKKELSGVINWFASDGDQVKAVMEKLIVENGLKKFAFFYQDDAYGRGPLATAHEILKKYNITQYIDVPYGRNTVDLSGQAEKVIQFSPEAIGLFSVAFTTEELIRKIGVERLANTTLFGISVIAEARFKRFLEENGLSMISGSRVPNPYVSGLDIVQEYRKQMDRENYPYDTYSLEGYIATSILIEAMKLVDGPITKESVMKQLESFDNFNLGGISFTFNPKTRELARNVWLQIGDQTDWPLFKSPSTYKEPDTNIPPA